MSIILGLDLGQANDPASAVILKKITKDPPPPQHGPPRPGFVMRLPVIAIREWELGTDYCDIVDSCLEIPVDYLIVDFGGVGRPVVDMLRRAATKRNYKGRIRPVQLIGSAGRASSKRELRGQHWNVPKIDIVNSIVLCQQQKYLQLPNDPLTSKLLRQLSTFQMKFTKAANLQFGNVPGANNHDDLVIALGLSCWWALNFCNENIAIRF